MLLFAWADGGGGGGALCIGAPLEGCGGGIMPLPLPLPCAAIGGGGYCWNGEGIPADAVGGCNPFMGGGGA